MGVLESSHCRNTCFIKFEMSSIFWIHKYSFYVQEGLEHFHHSSEAFCKASERTWGLLRFSFSFFSFKVIYYYHKDWLGYHDDYYEHSYSVMRYLFWRLVRSHIFHYWVLCGIMLLGTCKAHTILTWAFLLS